MISLLKATSVYNLTQEEVCKMMPTTTKSCESLCSNTSSSKGSASILYRRKTPPAGGIAGGRHATLIPATSEVKQRVLSARRLRIKTFQNQLADAQQTISELAHENRILRTLHKRQDSALAKYESTNAELPQLLHSHAEELRVWQTKYRNVQMVNKELEQKLKQKEAVILSLSDQNKYYSQLNKDKNLEERQRLTEKLQALEMRLQEKDNDMKLMSRKVQLEAKNFKQQVQREQQKTRDTLIKLEKARLELSGYRKLDELNLTEKFSNISLLRRSNNCNLEEEPKLKKFNKVVIKSDYNQLSTPETADYQLSQHTSGSNQKQTDVSFNRIAPKTLVVPTSQQSQSYDLALPQRCHDQKNCDASSSIADIPIFSTTTNQNDTPQGKILNCEFEQFEDSNNFIDIDGASEKDEAVDIVNSDYVLSSACDAESVEDDEPEKTENYGPDASVRIKDEILNIRKQISDDYKGREAFLDTFCRQATNSALREETPKKRNGISLGHNLPKIRKHKLLAALKEIDNSKSKES